MLARTLKLLSRTAVGLAFPSRCVHCGAGGSLLCGRCLSEATRLSGPVCDRCALPLSHGSGCSACAESPPAFARMIAVYQFDGAVRDAVHALKYDGLRAMAPVLGEVMAGHPALSRMRLEAVVPVPMHWQRTRARGYNHAELLAREIGRRLSLPVLPRALKRVRNTPRQVEAADEQERARQVASAFAPGAGAEGKRVLLIDDVATTGSTLNACARVLRRGGAQWVCAFVLAREV